MPGQAEAGTATGGLGFRIESGTTVGCVVCLSCLPPPSARSAFCILTRAAAYASHETHINMPAVDVPTIYIYIVSTSSSYIYRVESREQRAESREYRVELIFICRLNQEAASG